MKISLVSLLLACSLFLVSSCGVKGPLYHGKSDAAATVEKTGTSEIKESDNKDKTDEKTR